MMEYLPGRDARRADERGHASPRRWALAWLEQAGRALDAAHAAGVVHRDVKPANLMLGDEGDVRVTDFGIARIAGDVSLTSAGTILGTSGYMSPEQAVGGNATPASDRYRLAVVAFECSAGAGPTSPRRSRARPPHTRRRRSRRRRASTRRCRRPSTMSSNEGSRKIRRAFSAPVVSSSRASRPPRRARRHHDADLPAARRAAAAAAAASGTRHSRVSLRALVARAPRSARRRSRASLTRQSCAGAGKPSRAITVLRTATVAGKPQVRTVTVERAGRRPRRLRTRGRPVTARPPRRRLSQRPGLPATPGRGRRRRAPAAGAGGGRAGGDGLADRGVRALQPRRGPLLDRKLRGHQGHARPVREDPGEARRRSSSSGTRSTRVARLTGSRATRQDSRPAARIRRRGRSRSPAPPRPPWLHTRRVRVSPP